MKVEQRNLSKFRSLPQITIKFVTAPTLLATPTLLVNYDGWTLISYICNFQYAWYYYRLVRLVGWPYLSYNGSPKRIQTTNISKQTLHQDAQNWLLQPFSQNYWPSFSHHLLCALILYMKDGTYSLKPTPNDRFFWETFHATLRVFARNLLRGNRRKNYFWILFDVCPEIAAV